MVVYSQRSRSARQRRSGSEAGSCRGTPLYWCIIDDGSDDDIRCFFTWYGRYTRSQLDSTVNTNSRRHIEDVRTVITMITTDFEGGSGRSSSVAMVHLFCSTARSIL